MGDLDASCRRAGERNHGDIRVITDGIADLAAPAGDEVEDTFWETSPVKGFGQIVRRHRRVLARLEDDRRSDEQSWDDFLDNLA